MLKVKQASLDQWQRHKERWKNCKRCPLSNTRSQVVVLRGEIPCDILFIGEAPGESEDAIGRPFVGPAGSLFDNIIRDAEIEVGYRPRLAWTNVVCCMPPREGDENKLRSPNKDEAKACSPRLMETLRLCKPLIICLVGRVAEKYQPRDWYFREIRQFSIMHPSAILQNKDSKEGPNRAELDYHRCLIALSGMFKLIKEMKDG